MNLVLLVEIGFFAHIYFFGKNGIAALQKQRGMVEKINEDIVQLSGEISAIERDIFAWKNNDFFKEKIAREQLQMARKDDILFYVG